MKLPATLKLNDTIDIIAPGAKCHPEVLVKLKNFLASWQLNCHIPDDIFGDDILCANSAEKRFQQLQAALSNSQSKAIWCLVGGYGCTQLIPALEKMSKPTHSKIFMGFSDITALHIFLQDKWGWTTLHCPSARQSALGIVPEESLHLLKNSLFNPAAPIHYDVLPMNTMAEISNAIHAPIIGGNLHLIQASLGTQWQPSTTNKILFFEETNERGYRIARVFDHLRQVGMLDDIKGVLIGDFTGGNEADGSSHVESVLQEFARTLQKPVFRVNHIGHGKINNPLLLGSAVTLTPQLLTM